VAGFCGAIWGDAGYVSTGSAAFVEPVVLAFCRMVEVHATRLGEVLVIAGGLFGGWA
jgi:hypothetical protein